MSAAQGAMPTSTGATAGLAIFVKTPGHSPLKTRLAAGIGREAAETFHRLACAAVAEVARAAQVQRPGLTVYWAVAEAEALDDALWRDFPTIAQGEGDLGARMRSVSEALLARHDYTLLIGADAPQITFDDLLLAVEALDTCTYTLGPSSDGGFWLLGMRKLLPGPVWTETPWSQSITTEVLIKNSNNESCRRLRIIRDVDTLEDLLQLKKSVDNLVNKNPKLDELIYWLNLIKHP